MRSTAKTPREKLVDMLCDLGFKIGLDDFWIQKGGYRNHHWDLACWGADCEKDRVPATLYSWNTMTKCARYGIAIAPETGSHSMPNHFEVSAREPLIRKEPLKGSGSRKRRR